MRAMSGLNTLSLHDALPIYAGAHAALPLRSVRSEPGGRWHVRRRHGTDCGPGAARIDRKSTRLNSSHSQISYAVFCLKKKDRWAGGGDQLMLFLLGVVEVLR